MTLKNLCNQGNIHDGPNLNGQETHGINREQRAVNCWNSLHLPEPYRQSSYIMNRIYTMQREYEIHNAAELMCFSKSYLHLIPPHHQGTPEINLENIELLPGISCKLSIIWLRLYLVNKGNKITWFIFSFIIFFHHNSVLFLFTSI